MVDANVISDINLSLKAISNEISFNSSIQAVPIFDGTPEKCESFLRSVDNIASVLQNDQNIVKMALIRTSGLCAEAIRSYIQSTPMINHSWRQLRLLIEQQFGLVRDERVSLQLLRATKQGNLSISGYARLLSINCSKAWPNIDFNEALLQRQLTEIFISGLNSDYVRRRLIIKDPVDLTAAVSLAEAENVIQLRLSGFGQNSLTTPNTNISNKHEPMEVDMLSQPPTDGASTLPEPPNTHNQESLNENSYSNETDPNSRQASGYWQDYESYQHFSEMPNDVFALRSYGQNRNQCYYCHKYGHIKRNCFLMRQHMSMPQFQTPYQPQYRPRFHNTSYRNPSMSNVRPQFRPQAPAASQRYNAPMQHTHQPRMQPRQNFTKKSDFR